MSNSRKIRPVEGWIRQLIADNDFWVLRKIGSDRALGVSYSKEGLKWIMDKHGKFIYFKKARRVRREVNGKTFLEFIGDTDMNPNLYVEQFVPRDHKNLGNQIAEYLWISKAMKMLYFAGDEDAIFQRRPASLVSVQPGSMA